MLTMGGREREEGDLLRAAGVDLLPEVNNVGKSPGSVQIRYLLLGLEEGRENEGNVN